MLNKFAAKIKKWTDITSDDFFKFLRWGGESIDDSQALICSASTSGQALAFVVAQPCFVLDSYAIKPGTNPDDLNEAGTAIEEIIARESGVSRVLFVLPEGVEPPPGLKVVRFIEKPLSKEVTISHDDGTTTIKRIAVSPDNTTAAWVN